MQLGSQEANAPKGVNTRERTGIVLSIQLPRHSHERLLAEEVL